MEKIENNTPPLIIEDLENLRILLEKKRDGINVFLTSFLTSGYDRFEDTNEFIKNIINFHKCALHIDFSIRELIKIIEELNKIEPLPSRDIMSCAGEELNKIERLFIKDAMIYAGIKKFIWNLTRKIKEL
jgi:hypothetical protein